MIEPEKDQKDIITARVGYDGQIDASSCPYCGHIFDNDTIEQLECPICDHKIAWY